MRHAGMGAVLLLCSLVGPAGPSGTTSHQDWLAVAQRHIAEREYRASANALGLQAPNRAHNLRTYFDASAPVSPPYRVQAT